MENKNCRSCLFYGRRSQSCDYMLITHKRRGCSVKDCDKYLPSRGAKDLYDHYAGVSNLSQEDKKLLLLYDEGLNDVEIAKRLGKPKGTVTYRRERLGLPSQRQLEADAYDD